jgi:hypothetical protein
MLIYVILTTLPASKTTVATNWTAVAIIILYEVVFAFGWLGTCWVYGPEIAPLRYRHVAGSLGAAGEWFSTWVMVFGAELESMLWGPRFSSGLCSAVSLQQLMFISSALKVSLFPVNLHTKT